MTRRLGDEGSREVFNEGRLADRMETLGAIVRDTHVVYTNGAHGRDYVDKRRIFAHPWAAGDFAGCLANRFDAAHIDVVVGPGTMGAILARDVAGHLSFDTTNLVRCACAEKDKRGRLAFKPTYRKLIEGKRALLVDDVLRTGSTLNELIALTQEVGGVVVAAGAVVDRRNASAQTINAPKLECLLHYDFPSYPADNCPLCAAGVPINSELGHGGNFMHAPINDLDKYLVVE